MSRDVSRGHALVTGAIGGLGTAIVKRLIAAGIPVIGTDRRVTDIDPWIKSELNDEQSAMFTGYPLDVAHSIINRTLNVIFFNQLKTPTLKVP